VNEWLGILSETIIGQIQVMDGSFTPKTNNSPHVFAFQDNASLQGHS